MAVILIHIDDDSGELHFTGNRWKKMGGMYAQQIRVYSDQDSSREDVALTVLSAIQMAVREGRRILLCSDYSIGGVYGTSDRLWRVVWGQLSECERAFVTDFVIRCTANGAESFRQAVVELPGFQANVHILPKESVDVLAMGEFLRPFAQLS